MDMKIAQLTVTIDRLMLKTLLKREIAETKRMMEGVSDESVRVYMDGYLNGLRMSMCMLEELDDGKDEVAT